MFFPQIAAIIALATTATVAVPAPPTHVLHEKRSSALNDWVKSARVDGTSILPMRIGLTQANLDKGEAYVLEV